MGPAPAVADTRRGVRSHLAGLPADSLVLVACSGGADSLALAAAAAFEAPRAGLRAGAVTVDHGLQEGSRRRAAVVVDTCRSLGLAPVEAATVTVERGPGSGGPEAAARSVRYDALDAAALRHGATAVLLGHTRDDQAETVLLRLARGSGARSLAGMAATGGPGGHYLRPFLDLPRATTRAACDALGLQPWEDPHNVDTSYMRVRVRALVLPLLEETLGPGVAAALARTARLLRDDADALDAWAKRAGADAAGSSGSDPASDGSDRSDGSDGSEGFAGEGLDVDMLASLPAAVRRRVLLAAAISAGCPAGGVAASHVEALDALVTNWRGQRGVDLPGRVVARRRYGRLIVGAGEPSEVGAGEPSADGAGSGDRDVGDARWTKAT